MLDAAQALPFKAASQIWDSSSNWPRSRRAALPTLPPEHSSDDAAADCRVPASKSISHLLAMAVVHKGSELCVSARAPIVLLYVY